MFIHWGVYAVPAGYYHGSPVPGIGEWIMNHGKIPMAEYQQFAKRFDPVKFNAYQWVKIAKDAGMKYIVITSKHHDGFAMFCSAASKWNICDATPYGRDPLQELAIACRKEGIKLGFYYSQAQDWNNGGAASGGKWDPAQQHDMDDYIDQIAVPQLKELLTNYGPDVPAVVWWDTPTDMNQQRAEKLYKVVTSLRPDVIMNNRLGGDFQGDYETPEQRIPTNSLTGRDWETCMTINDTWGYKSDDNHFKSAETLVRNLIDIASKGGNYLLNVGPDATGVIPAPEVERLREIGKWMKFNREAIYGTTATPFNEKASDAGKQSADYGQMVPPTWDWRCTKRITPEGVTLYLHIFEWPKDGRFLVPGLKNSVEDAYMLKPTIFGSQRHLKTVNTADGLTISIPNQAPDTISSTIVLQIKGKLQLK
jgi:alpha-L-fucosidase